MLYHLQMLVDRCGAREGRDPEQEGGRQVLLISENSLSLDLTAFSGWPTEKSLTQPADSLSPACFRFSVFFPASPDGVAESGRPEFETCS